MSNGIMEEKKRFLLPVLYLLLASMATSIFFGVLVFLNNLGITFHYYRVSLLETAFLSRQLDQYGLLLFTLVAFFATVFLTMTFGLEEPIEYLPISVLGVGMILLASGLLALAAIMILVGQILVLRTKTIYQAGSHSCLSRKRVHALLVVYLLSLALLIEFPALIYWVTAAFKPSNTLGREAALLETNLMYAASLLSPWLYGAFLFGWLWAPATLFLRKKIVSKNSGSVAKSDTSTNTSLRIDAGKLSSKVLPILFLLGLSIFVGYYPYWHEPEWLVGTDVYWRYKGPLDEIAGMSVRAGFEQALKEHQSGFLILLLGLMRVTGLSSYQVVRYTPMVLTAMTAIATFYLARTLGLGSGASLLSGVASVMWMPTTIGIFTSILANWFAVVLWIVFVTILMKKDLKINIVGAAMLGSLFSLGILFVHPWSWGVFAAVTGLYLLIQLVGRRFFKRQLTLCVAFDSVGLVAGYVTLMLQTSQGLRITDALYHYTAVLRDPTSILTFPEAIEYFSTLWSPFLNPILVLMTIAGILVTMSNDNGSRRLTLSWLCVASAASVLATSLGSWGGGYLWRVFFVAPAATLTALGALQICRTLELKLGGESRARTFPGQRYWTMGVIVSTLAMSITSVMMSVGFPELGLFLSLVLNLLLMTLLFHSAHGDVPASHILGVTLAVLMANSGLRAVMPLLVDPHNIVR